MKSIEYGRFTIDSYYFIFPENWRSLWIYPNEIQTVLSAVGPPESRKMYVMPGVLFSADSIVVKSPFEQF